MFLLKLLIIFILTVITLFIFVPIRYSFKGTYYQKIAGEVHVSLIFGTVSLDAYLDSSSKNLTFEVLNIKKKFNINNTKKEKSDEDNFIKNVQNNKVKKTLIDRNEFSDLMIATKNLWDNIKPSIIFMNGKLGFEDPMWTGFLFSALSQITYLPKEFEINLDPIFNEQYLEGTIKVEGKMWILGILIILIKLLIINPIKNSNNS